MIVEKNVPIPLPDGAVLYANVFRPRGAEPVPVLMTHGPYGKDAHFADAFAPQWQELKSIYPGIDTEGSTGRYLRWEVADPERWIPWGYALVVVDSRGSGASPGFLHAWSPQEAQDYYHCIEWAGSQPWCNGKVGLLGISYYGINQWQVAALRPSHLAAICPWEGASDLYREFAYHGGILSNYFAEYWWNKQIVSIQHGNAATPYIDRDTGKRSNGPALDEATLRENRAELPDDIVEHPFFDAWWQQRIPDLSRIEVPVLSAGNWGGMGLHLRGSIEGFLGAGSQQKWLQMHGGSHFDSFYLPEYVQMQKRFFDHFLKGIDNGWSQLAPLQLEIRHVDHFEPREEHEWPLARTQWTRLWLDLDARTLVESLPPSEQSLSYMGMGPGFELSTPPLTEQTEITGPLTAVLWVASETEDMDLFLTLRAYDPSGKEVLFRGATDPAVPIAQGWLRVSHRATDPNRSRPWRPWRWHLQREPMEPGKPYRVEVEIWPTSIVLPPGYRLALRIDGRDFEREGATGPRKGSGPFLHTHPKDRDPVIFQARNTILSGGKYDSHLLLPVIPR